MTFYPPGTMPKVTDRGDFLLTSNPASWHSKDGFVDGAIRTGQRLLLWRSGYTKAERDEMARWSHAVGVGDGCLIEALGQGVVRSPLTKYLDRDFLYVHTDLTDPQRQDCVATWEEHVGDRYGWFTDATIGIASVTGTRWQVKRAGTVICSGLVTAGLGIYEYRTDPSFVPPAILAAYHGITGHTPYT